MAISVLPNKMTIPEASIVSERADVFSWGGRGDSASSKTVPAENAVAQATWNKSLDPGSYSTANNTNS